LTSCVEPAVPSWVIGDVQRIKQVLIYLAGNAIKFADRGEVSVSLGVAEQHGSAVVLRFEVNGSGISILPDELNRMFDPVTLGDDTASQSAHRGSLGLVIAKQLARLMGGEVGVHGMPGTGASFSLAVRVPIVKNAPVAGEPQGVATAPTEGAKFCGRVLVAEDDTVHRELVSAMLTAAGVQVLLAHDGKQAVDAASRGGVDLILMDCQMPELDGFAATRAIRASEPPDAWHVPIIALTANAMNGDRERCLAAGMNDYIAKPFKSAELHSKLDRWLPATATVVSNDATMSSASGQWALKTLEFNALDHIRTAGGANAERLLDNVVRLYCDSVPQMLTSMQHAARNGDCVALQRAAHALQSSSHNVGAIRLANLCRDLEQAARAGTIRMDRMQALEFEFNSVRRALQRVA
jgi:CheY-like chemotaxis protein